MYQYLKEKYGKEMLSPEWSTAHQFIDWFQAHISEMPTEHWKLARVNDALPYGPDNCFYALYKKHGRKIPVGHKELSRRCDEIFAKSGIRLKARYSNLKYRKKLNPKTWALYDYLRYCVDAYDKGILTKDSHMHRIDRSKPLAENNVYFSLSRGSGNNTFDEFLEHAIKEGYKLHQEPRTNVTDKDAVTLDDIMFIDTEFYDDVNRVCAAYRSIPKEENRFGDVLKFIEWSIRNGYTSYKDFRKVAPGPYSSENCVWDIFTQEGYNAHYKQIHTRIQRSKKLGRIEQKWRNLKTAGGLCKEWQDLEVFSKWYEEEIGNAHVAIHRKTTTKPFGPQNVIINAV